MLEWMACETERRLFIRFQGMTRDYAAAVAELRKNMGTLSKAEYTSCYRMAESLRFRAAQMEHDYRRHIADHGCTVPEDTLQIVNQ
jgi:hypothetical protein